MDKLLGKAIIVDDDVELLDNLEELLSIRGLDVQKAVDADGCLQLLKSRVPDMAMIDIGLEDEDKDGIWLLQRLKEMEPDLPVVVLSGYDRLEVGVRAMRLGASDFIEKPIMPQYLLEIIRRTIEVGRDRRLCRRLGSALEPPKVRLSGKSNTIKSLTNKLQKNAEKNCRIMLLGPAGSGKEHVARYVHQISGRQSQPFIPVNCRRKSIEKQLFGKLIEGTYKVGLLEQVHEGTLYLDEICALPIDAQKRLVSALVRGEYERQNGGVVTFNCRVISGTSENIENHLKQGTLTQDLFDRLQVVSIEVPALDSRRDDIPALCEDLVRDLHRKCGLKPREFSQAALQRLQTMSWPGNVRQLRNLVERLLFLPHNKGPIDIEEITLMTAESMLGAEVYEQNEELLKLPLREARNEFERQYLLTQLQRHNGNISIAAKSVGMERSALHRKIKSLQIETRSPSMGVNGDGDADLGLSDV